MWRNTDRGREANIVSRRNTIDLQVQPPRSHEIGKQMRAPAETSFRTFESQDLFDGASEVGIEHDGALYRLKITRQGKLILNK